jgi:hypothetical protein
MSCQYRSPSVTLGTRVNCKAWSTSTLNNSFIVGKSQRLVRGVQLLESLIARQSNHSSYLASQRNPLDIQLFFHIPWQSLICLVLEDVHMKRCTFINARAVGHKALGICRHLGIHNVCGYQKAFFQSGTGPDAGQIRVEIDIRQWNVGKKLAILPSRREVLCIQCNRIPISKASIVFVLLSPDNQTFSATNSSGWGDWRHAIMWMALPNRIIYDPCLRSTPWR